MRRKKRGAQAAQTISLFPFMAVLICTFGVLIILLVIVVKAADTQAEVAKAEQKANHQSEISEYESALGLQQIRVEGIRSIRPDLLGKLSYEKTRRASLQADIDRLASELQLVLKQRESLSAQSESLVTEDLTVELKALQQQLAVEKDRLSEKRAAADVQQQTKFSIVPYDAPGGSPRRPVYIECLAKEIVIQPYDIRLTAKDFVRPILPNNPLDAALIAVREYFLKNNIDDNEVPYPLLIVRPQGSKAYALARHAIKTWDEEFGYELIPVELELEFGEADPQLKKQMELAVEAARNRQREFLVQNQLQRGAAGRSSRGQTNLSQTSGLQASSRFGGFVDSNGRVLQASAAESTGGETGDGDDAQRHQASTIAGARGESNSGATRDADIQVKGLDAEGGSIAEQQGANWGVPGAAGGAVAYRRPVKILLGSNEIVMSPQLPASQQTVFSLADPRSALQELVQAIWTRMDSWGVTGVGGYWKPELNVVVTPGAEARFAELKRLLDGSGIDVMEYQR